MKAAFTAVILTVAAPIFAALPVMELWALSTRPEGHFETISQERNQPLLVGDVLYYANNHGDVVALQRTQGYALWRQKMAGPVVGALAFGRSKLFVGDSKGNLTALNSYDGSASWTFKIESEWLSPPTVIRDKVCASTSAEEVYCLREKDGTELWHYTHRGDEKMTIRGSASPTVFADTVFQGFADGYLSALQLSDGKVLWTKKLRTRARFYDVDMPVYVDDRGVLVATFDGNLYLLDRTTGAIQWSFAVGSYGGFLVEADRFYFSGLNGFVYAIDRATGTPIWKTGIESGVGLTPARVGQYIVVATTADPVYVLSDKTGEILWTRALGAGTFAAIASSSAEGLFYALSNYGNLFAFQVARDMPCSGARDMIVLPSALWSSLADSACRI